MARYESIKIDIDVYKAIVAAKLSFSETPNDILRRLLNIDSDDLKLKNNTKSLRPWKNNEISLPHGTIFKTIYNNKEYEGSIIDGEWSLNGSKFSSPSAAISAIAKTKSGKATNLNGWKYWKILTPGSSEWKDLDALRSRTVTLEDLD
ncbi:hypothetical protein MWN33_09365 [Starkeya koreensis]|uniref:Negative modulator of initiation of replication SeqA N-terminal domain-containing protein n=1 Tax=Ancylobacter koreensis TaxID=266121 RepID=A0ABT0DM10_9HYPH|nr:hypothetical protein [Ancylobacter koreensis]MCK0208239.1 hypothetical protein [Ancylobacter koreensis]